MTKPFLAIAAVAGVVFATAAAEADTTDVKWKSVVEIEKAGAHCADDTNCFNRYHPAIQPVARANPGDHIVFHTRDALDADLDLGSNADDVT
ncbi:MAG TPA: acetamidase/formamidase family protein, partial [Aestuariivirgaceae bacterium]|nr:acetamidase/formamidase family protein [Aestuariivirgaceae bacterium]